jgi:hypothetical protein
MSQQLNPDGSLYDPRQPTALGNNGNNSTNYDHPQETNLLNLHKAMKYNALGEPQVRVHVDGISLEGDVIVNEVTIKNDLNIASMPEVSVFTDSGNTLNIAGEVTQGTTPWQISGNGTANAQGNPMYVDVTNGTITVGGTVALDTATLAALENINATVSGTVNIGTMPPVFLSNDDSTPLQVIGTVNIGTIPEVEIKNDSGNPVPISGTVTANITGTPTVAFGSTATDAFGRLRVSNPFTLFDGAIRYRDDEFKWNQVDTGNGLSVFQSNESSMLMSVSGNGDSAVRQSKQVFSYQPGKSLLTLTTFVMNAPTAGLRQRVGYFGAQNGIYFEVDGTTLNLVIRKYTSGSVDDTTEKFSQATWNGDKLNGTGASGITLDVSHAQIFWSDVEWLGVGSVRCGFVINGQFIVCHIFHHANILDKVYMTTASLPVRYELTSTGAAGTMRAICSTVISEGGYSNRSQSRAIGTSLTGKNLSQAAYRPLVCIRLKSANIDSIVVPTKFDLYGLQQAAFSYRIILNPTLTDASWTSAGDNSSVEYDLSATALTGGTVIDQGIFVGSNKGGTASVSSSDVDFSNQLGRTIAGVSDIWCLAAIATTNNDDAVASVTWQEHG